MGGRLKSQEESAKQNPRMSCNVEDVLEVMKGSAKQNPKKFETCESPPV